MKTNKSPYTAAITGGGFLFEETNTLLPLLQSENRELLLKDEAMNNRLLQINSETSRKRIISEISRRYTTMPVSFWVDYETMSVDDKKIAIFYVILKTYKILFDFHINITMRKWNSISKAVSHDDIMMEFNEISANDEFVDSWSDATKRKVASAYLTILRRIGMLAADDSLNNVTCSNFDYYIAHGEPWFLEACLLQPWEIEKFKQSML